VARRAGGLVGSIERRGQPSGRAKPTVISSKGSDCGELDAALALALAIAIDPLSLTREPATRAPAPPPAQAPAAEHAAPEPAATPSEAPSEPSDLPLEEDDILPEPEPTKAVLYVAVGPSLAVGALPKASWGVRLLAGFSYDLFELDVEGRFDPEVEVQVEGGRIEASLLLGTIAPCVRAGWVVACASLSLGALRGTGSDFDHARADNTLQASVGTRVALDVPFSQHVSMRLGIESQFPLIATQLQAGDRLLWSTPAMSFAGTALLASRFP
jgi:hypothetical protein